MQIGPFPPGRQISHTRNTKMNNIPSASPAATRQRRHRSKAGVDFGVHARTISLTDAEFAALRRIFLKRHGHDWCITARRAYTKRQTQDKAAVSSQIPLGLTLDCPSDLRSP